MPKIGERQFEVESIVVKKSARHKMGSDDDIDPDLDSETLFEVCKSKDIALSRVSEIAKRDKDISLWNVITLQEQVYDYEEEDDPRPVWIGINTEEFFILELLEAAQ